MNQNVYDIVIPVPPNSINEIVSFGSQFSDIRSLKKKWEKIAMHYLQELIDTEYLPEYFTGIIGVRFFIYFEKYRKRDGDNYYLMCKGIIDSMVELGLVEDDNSEIVKFDGIRCYVDKERPRVVVKIIEYLNKNDEPYNGIKQDRREVRGFRTGFQAELEDQARNTSDETESISEEESLDRSRIGID